MKMKHKNKKYNITKLNNQGMSLLELLLAIVVLSTVSLVFYHGFIASAETNAKAKVQHKATSLAQNLLEGMKAENRDSIIHQFVYPFYNEVVAGTAVENANFDILTKEMLGGTYANIGTLPTGVEGTYAVSTDGGKTSTVKQTDSGQYVLYIQNLKMDGTAFDALITLDASAYAEDGAGNVASGQGFNDYEEAQVPIMDGNFDAIISGLSTYDRAAINDLELKTGTTFGTAELLRIQRNITIDVTSSALLNGQIKYKVKATYEYQYLDPILANRPEPYTVTKYIFDNTQDPSKALRNIYLFFQPSVTYGWGGSDYININTDSGTELGLYLIKQLPEDTDPDSVDPTKHPDLSWENTGAYEAQVNIVGPNLVSESPVKVRTNLGYSLKDNSALTTKQAKYRYRGMERADEYFDLTDLSVERATDKIMDVTVEIFSHGTDTAPANEQAFRDNTGEKKATMTGTIRN